MAAHDEVRHRLTAAHVHVLDHRRQSVSVRAARPRPHVTRAWVVGGVHAEARYLAPEYPPGESPVPVGFGAYRAGYALVQAPAEARVRLRAPRHVDAVTHRADGLQHLERHAHHVRAVDADVLRARVLVDVRLITRVGGVDLNALA